MILQYHRGKEDLGEKKVLKSWGLEKYKNNEFRRISGQKVPPKRQWIKLQSFLQQVGSPKCE